MNERNAQESVIKAGHALAQAGLIARTWGNVSCRIDRELFAITPSGRAYETLSPHDIVICRVEDASWAGEIRPSSEKGVHALIYRQREDVGFVIHTHQKYASVIAASGLSALPKTVSFEGAPVSGYGLPGSEVLQTAVLEALPQAQRSMLLSHHGALCFGPDSDAAFTAAHALESASAALIEKRCGLYYCSDPTDNSLEMDENIVMAIRKAYAGICYVKCSASPAIMEIIRAGNPLLPMVDDFAQIVGVSAEIAKKQEEIAAALLDRQCVLLPEKGAYYCAASEKDAEAVGMIVEKNALAAVFAQSVGMVNPIAPEECLLMRRHYLTHYSKIAETPLPTI